MGTKSNSEWTDLRPYNETHPWLAFGLGTPCLPPDLLAQLGGVSARCKVLEGVYLHPKVSGTLHSIYLAKGVHGTTAIEGNSLTEGDVRRRISGGKEAPKSLEYQEQEVDNVIAACNAVKERVVNQEWTTEISVERIKEYNALVLKDLPLEDGVVPGEIRDYPVGVFDYVAPEWGSCDELLHRLCLWLNKHDALPPDDHPVVNAILRAILCHVYVAWIHPFGDGNGRTARLLEVHILMAAGVPSIAAHLLSNHYNRTRNEYFRHLAQASKSGGDLVPFIKYAIQGFQDGLEEQFSRIEKHQADVAWRDYVYSVFQSENGITARRRRQLILAIGARPRFVSTKKLTHLTPELAALYAVKTPKTLSRDLNALKKMGLVTVIKGNVLASTWRLNAFKPDARKQQVKAATKIKAPPAA